MVSKEEPKIDNAEEIIANVVEEVVTEKTKKAPAKKTKAKKE
jgi:hypothetical protein